MIAIPDIPQKPPFRFVTGIEKSKTDVCITHLDTKRCNYFKDNNTIHAEALIEFAAQTAICNALLNAPKTEGDKTESSQPGMLAAVKHFERFSEPEMGTFLKCELRKHAEMAGFAIYNATILKEDTAIKIAQIQFAVFQP